MINVCVLCVPPKYIIITINGCVGWLTLPEDLRTHARPLNAFPLISSFWRGGIAAGSHAYIADYCCYIPTLDSFKSASQFPFWTAMFFWPSIEVNKPQKHVGEQKWQHFIPNSRSNLSERHLRLRVSVSGALEMIAASFVEWKGTAWSIAILRDFQCR